MGKKSTKTPLRYLVGICWYLVGELDCWHFLAFNQAPTRKFYHRNTVTADFGSAITLFFKSPPAAGTCTIHEIGMGFSWVFSFLNMSYLPSQSGKRHFSSPIPFRMKFPTDVARANIHAGLRDVSIKISK